MPELTYRCGVPQYTLDHYNTEFADRHLLHGVVEKFAREKPGFPAIVDAENGASYSYQIFDRLTTALALKLLEAGFRKGDFFATSLPLLPEHIFLEYACFKIGVIHAPLDLRLKGPEVIRSLGLIQAKGFAFLGKTPIADFTPLGKAVQQHCPYVKYFLQFSPPEETIEGAVSAFSLREEATPLVLEPTQSPCWDDYQKVSAGIQETDGAQVIYTTGSTGMPKPALLSHRNITCQNMCLAGGFGMPDGMRMLVNLPPSHVGCQAEQLMTTFFVGGTAVVLYIFDAEKTLKAIQDHQIEAFGQIPAMFNMQWRLPNYSQYDLSSLKFALHGGQQVSRPFIESLSKMSPNFGTGLGLTEMAGFVTYTPLDGTVEDMLGSVGFDMPVTPLSIRQPMNADGSSGAELPDGEAGEICFSGPQVFIDYVGNPEAYRKTVSTDGVCYTGDLGAKTPQGLRFAGRSKLVIKPKGYQVHPAQVEEHFASLTHLVAGCAAVGVPHEIYSEAIILFVERKPEAEVAETHLQDHAKNIAAYMRPSSYIVLGPGELPLNRVAKTDYVLLKEKALAHVGELKQAGKWDG
jgi:acyl-CoA synthetase (AMP-forming)/AMP-acid ligase II